jgi:integrase
MTKRHRNGTGSISERDGRPGSPWQGQISVDGRRISVYGRTAAEVQAKLDAAKVRAKAGLLPTDARLTVAKYLDRWLDRDRDVRERTIARYRSLVRIHVLPVIGSRKLSELQPDDVRRVLAKMKATGLSPTTRSHVRAVLRLALRDAVRDGLLSRNVASRDYVSAPAPNRPKPKALRDDEIRAILAAVEGDRLGPVYAFAMATGARLGEILGLRWRDVDRERGELRFTQTVGRLDNRDLWGATKNASSDRTFPLTAGVRSALTTQKAMQDAGLTGAPPALLIVDGVARGPLVFTSTTGGALNPSYVTHHFQKLLTAAGIEPLRLHDVRHAFVSALYAEGVSLEEISGLVGHSSTATTRAIYLHLLPDGKLPAASKLDRFFADTGS